MERNYVKNIYWRKDNIIHIKIYDVILLKNELNINKLNGSEFVINIFEDSIKDVTPLFENYIFQIYVDNISISLVEKESKFIQRLISFFNETNLKQPESCQLVNPPKSFSIIWEIVKPLLSTETQNKICIRE